MIRKCVLWYTRGYHKNDLATRAVRRRMAKSGRGLRGVEPPRVGGRKVLSMLGMLLGTARDEGRGMVPLVSQKFSMSRSVKGERESIEK